MTPAAIRVVDVPGTGPQLLGNLRQVDALLAVIDGWSDAADPASDLETLKLELLVADRDHVERRLERVAKEAKSGDPAKRKEVETLQEVLAHLDAGNTLADWPGELPEALEPLTTMPLLAIENGPGGIDLKLEAELAELPDEEAAGISRRRVGARGDRPVRLKAALDLITFFTAGDKETRSWTLRDGQTALEAAATIHTDIARGFIRARGDPLGRPARVRVARRGVEARPAAARGKDLRRHGRRRPQHPLQRVIRVESAAVGSAASAASPGATEARSVSPEP